MQQFMIIDCLSFTFGTPCTIPFDYGGMTYNGCTSVDGGGFYWCLVPGGWDWCNDDCRRGKENFNVCFHIYNFYIFSG